MIVADVFTVTFLILGLLIVLPALWLLYGAVWPSATARAQERVSRMPIASFFAGLATIGAFTGATFLFGQSNIQPLAFITASFGLGWSLFGVGALARHVGSRMPSTIEIPWRAHLRGSIVLELSFLVPLLGWLLIFPIALTLGAGAATMSLFRRSPFAVPVRNENVEIMA